MPSRQLQRDRSRRLPNLPFRVCVNSGRIAELRRMQAWTRQLNFAGCLYHVPSWKGANLNHLQHM